MALYGMATPDSASIPGCSFGAFNPCHVNTELKSITHLNHRVIAIAPRASCATHCCAEAAGMHCTCSHFRSDQWHGLSIDWCNTSCWQWSVAIVALIVSGTGCNGLGQARTITSRTSTSIIMIISCISMCKSHHLYAAMSKVLAFAGTTFGACRHKSAQFAAIYVSVLSSECGSSNGCAIPM